MIIFQTPPRLDEYTRIVVLFGTGLIGTSVCNRIIKYAEYSSFDFQFNWNNPNQSRQDAKRIFNHLSDILTLHSNANLSSCKIAFIWCAGKAGFTASKKNMEDELVNFDIVLDLVKSLTGSFPETKIFFHLLSSAGGLYEGQRLVHDKTRPEPKRYYGQLKYKQEMRLKKLEGRVASKVYRPTTVYGFIGHSQRMGLISTLIANGIKNKVSTIFGSLSTLRDYVFNDDIGAHIGKNLFHDCSAGETTVHLLGSGKPSSIYEIRHFVEQVIGRKIYLEFRTTPETENTMDITINSSALPVGWTPIDVKSGIRYVKELIIAGKVSNSTG